MELPHDLRNIWMQPSDHLRLLLRSIHIYGCRVSTLDLHRGRLPEKGPISKNSTPTILEDTQREVSILVEPCPPAIWLPVLSNYVVSIEDARVDSRVHREWCMVCVHGHEHLVVESKLTYVLVSIHEVLASSKQCASPTFHLDIVPEPMETLRRIVVHNPMPLRTALYRIVPNEVSCRT